MRSELREQSACGAADGPSPGLPQQEFVGRGRVGGEIYVHIDDMHRARLG